MKRTMFLILFFIVLSLVFTGMILAQGKGPAAKGASVWDYLKRAGFAKSWKMWPGTTATYQGPEPHGAFLTTYVNDTALKSINAKKGKFADGSIIAQENYSKDKKLKFIAVMYKVKGYNPQGGDWFWAQYKPDGRIESEGKVDECIKCHVAQKGNDYVYTSKMK
jgi:hypothetical protein